MSAIEKQHDYFQRGSGLFFSITANQDGLVGKIAMQLHLVPVSSGTLQAILTKRLEKNDKWIYHSFFLSKNLFFAFTAGIKFISWSPNENALVEIEGPVKNVDA